MVRLDGTACLLLWNVAGQVRRHDGAPLQVCHDAGIDVWIQVNESHNPEEESAQLKNAAFPGGQAQSMAETWCHSLVTAQSGRHDIWLRMSPPLKTVTSLGR